MTDPDNSGGMVNYSVKELIARVEAKLDTVLLSMHDKVDRNDLQKLEGRVDSLEASRDRRTWSGSAWRWAVPVIIAALGVAVGIVLRFN